MLTKSKAERRAEALALLRRIAARIMVDQEQRAARDLLRAAGLAPKGGGHA